MKTVKGCRTIAIQFFSLQWKDIAMGNAKEDVRAILEQAPDDVSLEDIQYSIYVLQKIARGREDVAGRRVLDQSEVERRMAKWLEPSSGPR